MPGAGVAGGRVAEHQDGGGDDVDHESVHAQQVGDAAPRVAEFAGGEDVDHAGLDCDRHQFAAAERLGALAFRLAPVLEEIPGASLVHDVEQRPCRDQHDHEDDIGLHDGRRNGRRDLGKRIAGEHYFLPAPGTGLARAVHMAKLIRARCSRFYRGPLRRPTKKSYGAIDSMNSVMTRMQRPGFDALPGTMRVAPQRTRAGTRQRVWSRGCRIASTRGRRGSTSRAPPALPPCRG